MKSINKLVSKFLSSDKNIDEFLEIESTGLGDTPEKSPYPSEKDKEEEEDK